MNWFKRIFHSKKQEANRIPGTGRCDPDLFNDGGKRGCGGQYRASRGRRLESPRYQSGLQSFFSSRLDNKGNDKKYNSQYGKHDAQGKRELKKEFACQSDCKDSFRNIGQITRRKLQSGFVKNISHMAKVYRICEGSSNVLYQQTRGRP